MICIPTVRPAVHTQVSTYQGPTVNTKGSKGGDLRVGKKPECFHIHSACFRLQLVSIRYAGDAVLHRGLAMAHSPFHGIRLVLPPPAAMPYPPWLFLPRKFCHFGENEHSCQGRIDFESLLPHVVIAGTLQPARLPALAVRGAGDSHGGQPPQLCLLLTFHRIPSRWQFESLPSPTIIPFTPSPFLSSPPLQLPNLSDTTLQPLVPRSTSARYEGPYPRRSTASLRGRQEWDELYVIERFPPFPFRCSSVVWCA